MLIQEQVQHAIKIEETMATETDLHWDENIDFDYLNRHTIMHKRDQLIERGLLLPLASKVITLVG
jgi:hypothetical protein